MRRPACILLTASVLSLSCLGCAVAVDKQGARSPRHAVTLRLGAADVGEPSLAYFVGAVDRASAGRLAVRVDRRTYSSETPGGPARLAPGLARGDVDLALIPSRDWAANGDPRFAALQAPFLVSSTAATIALARSAVAGDLLEGMAAHHAIGLALVPGEPRRLLTRRPVVDLADLAGARIRISDSDQTSALLAALGAEPVQGMSTSDARLALHDGSLDGIEMSPVYLGQNGYNLSAPYLTSFALIPKFEVLAASSASWAELSDRDRRALGRAGDETVEWESTRLADDEAGELTMLCRNGLVVVEPAASSLRSWHSAAPSLQDATAVAAARDIRHVLPAGRSEDASALPGTCPLATSAVEARALHRAADPRADVTLPPTRGPTIPPGTYVERVTAEEFAAVGLNGSDFARDVTYTWHLHPDGTFLETQDPDYPDQGPQQGWYGVDGYQLTMTYRPTPTGNLPPERAHWSYYQGTLTFSRIEVQDTGALPLYQQPWRRID